MVRLEERFAKIDAGLESRLLRILLGPVVLAAFMGLPLLLAYVIVHFVVKWC
jgi:hypothetical protein